MSFWKICFSQTKYWAEYWDNWVTFNGLEYTGQTRWPDSLFWYNTLWSICRVLHRISLIYDLQEVHPILQVSFTTVLSDFKKKDSHLNVNLVAKSTKSQFDFKLRPKGESSTCKIGSYELRWLILCWNMDEWN